ncbi:UNVERIFIED_CONTAM: hypothetical protein Sindi_0462300 [Sesamum indicum]
MASGGPTNNPSQVPTDEAQAQMRRENQRNFLDETGTQVKNMVQGVSDVGKGAAQGVMSLAQGAALGAANVAQGAADAVKNTVGPTNATTGSTNPPGNN